MKQDPKNVFVSFLVAVAVVILAHFGFHKDSVPAPVNSNTGLSQVDVGIFPDGTKNGDLYEKWESSVLPQGTNQVALFTNRTGRDAFVFLGSVDILSGQTASSTYKVSIFSTTTSSVPSTSDYDALAGNTGKASLINGVLIATSSTATTTSSVYASQAQKGNGFIVVPNGSTVFGYIQQNTAAVTGCYAATGVCEVATSTNRGFNPVFNIKYYSTQL